MHLRTDVATTTMLHKRKVFFYFCIGWRWHLAGLVGFIILGISLPGVKPTCSWLPKTIRYFDRNSLSQETSVVETTRAL